MRVQSEYEGRVFDSLLEHADRDRERAVESLHLHRVMTPAHAMAVEGYWRRVGRMVSALEDLGRATTLCRKIDADIRKLQTLELHLWMQRDSARHLEQRQRIRHVLMVLGAVRTVLYRRRRHLADEALLRYLLAGPAFPERVPREVRDEQERRRRKPVELPVEPSRPKAPRASPRKIVAPRPEREETRRKESP